MLVSATTLAHTPSSGGFRTVFRLPSLPLPKVLEPALSPGWLSEGSLSPRAPQWGVILLLQTLETGWEKGTWACSRNAVPQPRS
jgi:hypothetical protein